ncbi:MAG: hypothetical protein ACREOW_12935 [Thermodesulfobacteriota bacterium]
MKYEFTADEARTIADTIAEHLRKQKYKVSAEKPISNEALYRTTLFAKKAELTVLVEAQGVPAYGKTLQGLAHQLAADRKYCELYIATDKDANMRSGILMELDRDGVGLMLLDEGIVKISRKPKNFALVVTPDPTLKFGKCKTEVMEAVHKFNNTNRKDGLRDMCEIVERLTEELAVTASRRGHINLTEGQIKKHDWSNQIDTLSSKKVCTSGHSPLISEPLKTDLHSFRGARNLIDHPVKTKQADKKREKQFAERMMMGPRLASELISIKRKLR